MLEQFQLIINDTSQLRVVIDQKYCVCYLIIFKQKKRGGGCMCYGILSNPIAV